MGLLTSAPPFWWFQAMATAVRIVRDKNRYHGIPEIAMLMLGRQKKPVLHAIGHRR